MCCPGVFQTYFFFSSRRRHTRFKCDWSSDVCSSDLTDHKRAEAALRTTEKLAAAGRMAAALAHEINNPLESVTNLVYLAKRERAVPEPVRNYLKPADEELVRIAHIPKQALGPNRASPTPEPLPIHLF